MCFRVSVAGRCTFRSASNEVCARREGIGVAGQRTARVLSTPVASPALLKAR
jgi:hypothetical protein